MRGRTRWSRARRAASSYLCLLSLLAAVDLFLGIEALDNWVTVVPFVVFSVVYFLWVVVGVIFLTSEDFRPNPRRLALDTTISIFFSIIAFSLVYRLGGISLETGCVGEHAARDYAYFSAVTFSTLGYGDFRPCPDIRLIAAFQAIFGNLHLGLIVGSAFFLAQERGKASEEKTTNDGERSNDEHS